MHKSIISILVFVMFISVAAAQVLVSTADAEQNNILLEVKYHQLTKEAQKQIDCLAENIYYEAGYEPEEGKIAVALVTLNRVNNGKFPKDICSVVKQKTETVCQFSWFCEVKKEKHIDSYNEAKRVAIYVYANYEKLPDLTQGALYYHADYVNPRWKLQKTVQIGRHIFYKES